MLKLIAMRAIRFVLLFVFAAGIYRFGIYELGWSNNLKYPFSKIVVAILLVAVCVFTLVPSKAGRKSGRLFFAIWVIAFLLFAPFYLLKYLMGVNDIETVMVFLEGTAVKDATNIAIADLMPYISKEGFTVIAVFAASYFLYRTTRYFGAVLFVLACVSFYLHPLTRYVSETFLPNPAHDLISIEKDFHPVQITARPDRPKNVIIIYLESLERTYFEIGATREAMADLIPLAKTGFEAINVAQVRGTENSVPGNVATQCGVPLLPTASMNPLKQKLVTTEDILPKITCLSDILVGDGYNASYVVGTDMEPMALGRFLRSHGYKNLFGLGSVSPEDREKYKMNWGVTDEYTFAKAEAEIRRMNAEGAPFMLSMATMATHGPDGFPDKDCSFESRVDSKLPRSMYCTVQHVKEIVELVDELGIAQNTVIALMSDHLAQPNVFRNALADKERRNLFILLNAGQTGVTDKPALAFDIFPTILEAAGYELKDRKANFGTSLFSDTPGLVSTVGPDRINAAIRGNRALAEGLWK
jgi:phosphoglycerol transferase